MSSNTGGASWHAAEQGDEGDEARGDTRFSILLIRLALWSLVLLGFAWCLGVRGLKLD